MRLCVWTVAVVLLSGCVSAPEVRLVPEGISQEEMSMQHPPIRVDNVPWWSSFDDDVLDALISQGLGGNPSRQIALARLAQAETELNVAKASRWPWLQARGNREVFEFRGRDPDTRTDIGALETGWDAGLWGKRRLAIEQAEQFQQQRWFEQQAIVLALSASIADVYYQIVERRTQGSLLAAQTSVSRDLERLIEARFRLGQAPANELYQQREQTALLEQLELVNTTRRGTLERSLDVLLGERPDANPRVMRTQVPTAPTQRETGAVEDLVRHRADIRAGYARLQQVAAEVGLRFAERLPALQVTASLTSLTSKALSSEWVGYGLDLAAPIFTGGRLKGLEQRARQVLEEGRQRYFALWLEALNEVSSLQWQYQQQQRVIGALSARRDFAQQALETARDRYIRGDQNYLDVLTALRGLQDADRSLVFERRQLVTLWIQVTESVGQPMCGAIASCTANWQL